LQGTFPCGKTLLALGCAVKANLDDVDLIMILALRPGPGGDPETSAPTGCQPGDDVVVGWLRAAWVLLSGRQRAGHFGVGPRPTVEKLAEPRAHSAASRSVTTQAENHMKATPRSALFQLNLVASSYPSWCGHHGLDSEIDLSPAHIPDTRPARRHHSDRSLDRD